MSRIHRTSQSHSASSVAWRLPGSKANTLALPARAHSRSPDATRATLERASLHPLTARLAMPSTTSIQILVSSTRCWNLSGSVMRSVTRRSILWPSIRPLRRLALRAGACSIFFWGPRDGHALPPSSLRPRQTPRKGLRLGRHEYC